MTTEQIVEKVFLFLGGGVLVGTLNYFNNKRTSKAAVKKTDADILKQSFETDLKSFELLKETWKDEFTRLNNQVTELLRTQNKLELKIEALERENRELKALLNELKK